MKKILAFILSALFTVGVANAALFESGTKDAQPMVLYGKYNNTIVPVKVAEDGSMGAQGEDPSVIFNVKTEYGAKGDGIILQDGNITATDATFTSLTASFTSADIGKVITINGAGGSTVDLTTTIASVTSATEVELTDVAVATVVDVAYCYGTDDTVAIQAAMDAVGALTIKYGTVFFPAGIYIVNGAYSGTNNSQLAIPTITNATGNTMGTMVIKGVTPFKATSFTNINTGGSIIYSTRNGASGTDSILSGSAVGSANNLTLMGIVLENISFKTVQNPANTAINLERVTGATGRHVLIDSGLNISSYIPLPTTATSYGLKTPGGQNNGTNGWEELRIRGFYNGIKVGEHFNLKSGYVLYTVYGLRLQAMSHSSQIDYISIERTNNTIICDGAHAITIDMLDIEHNGTDWTAPDKDIIDTSNACVGSINYFVIGVGGASNSFDINGTTGISTFSTTGTRRYHLVGDNIFLRIVDTSTGAATSGGNLILQLDETGATDSGERLGGVFFGGATNNSQNLLTSLEIAGFAEEDFTSSKIGSQMRFYTTPLATNTKTQVAVLTSAGRLGIGNTAPNGMLVVDAPAAQTIAATDTITDNACGSLKLITAAGAVTTNTTNTFTAPAAGNEGCIMHVCNTGANNITLDNNPNFKSAGGADVVMTADDCVTVGSTGASGVWYQLTPLQAN